MEDLRVGSAVIKEVLGLQIEKLDRQARAKSNEKAVAQAMAEKARSLPLSLNLLPLNFSAGKTAVHR